MSDTQLPKQYSAEEVEPRWIQFWKERDYFHADETAAKAPYAITLPPPNVTGSLHMGHALGGTLQDILIRWQRMCGANSMWMPGTDHAGIATQMMVERDLKATENKSRHDLGRDGFLERVWAWKEKYGGRIQHQLRLMGFSLDWERERFTMDPAASRAVREAFVRLYEEGLIYRAHRLVNWCTDCYTAISDLEVNNVDEKSKLWRLRYPVVGQPDTFIEVATTRPETMLGDTGVAVHPEDERYRDLVGKNLALPLCDREIPIVADTFVDPEFGSGAVKVTPAHDENDFACGERCGLESLSIIDFKGRMIDPAPEKYRGMTVKEARKAVLADLEAGGFLVGDEDYTVPVARCDRSNTVIEPLLSEQWWLKMKPLAEPAIKAVEEGKTRFVPELWTKTYMHWMTNIRDWTISRQLWWGHRIPAWFCNACDHVTVVREDPTACGGCGGTELSQDDDVLDTWFSSGLWPFSTLGWPDENRALKTFYPNAVLVTAPDIIFFWVARMMMMGLHFVGKVPFREVFLTPIVTDEDGEKMSKVKGNVIDPLDLVHGATYEQLVEGAKGHPAAKKHIDKHLPKGIVANGSDAVRFSLAAMAMPGRNIRLSMERIEGYRNFVNKLWNASRFSLMNMEGFDAERFATAIADGFPKGEVGLTIADRWIFTRLQRVADKVNEYLGAYRFSDAANALYHFVWGELCDWYIELSKNDLRAEGSKEAEERRFLTQGTLATVLESTLRLLHPVMPFVTEEIWHQLPRPKALPDSLVITVFPQADQRFVDEQAEAEMELIQEMTSAIRTLRSTYNVKPSATVRAEIRTQSQQKRDLLERHRGLIESLARAELAIAASGDAIPQSAKSIVGADVEVIVPLEGLIDVAAECARIEKEIGKTDKEIERTEKKLGNKKFVERAPAEVVEKEKARLADEKQRREHLAAALEALR